MIKYLQLELVVIGPVLTKGSEPGDPGLDAVTLRNPDGTLILNGKHLHGRAKHAAFELADLANNHDLGDWARNMLGPVAPKDESARGDGSWEPLRSSISFEELRCGALVGRTSKPRDYRLEKDELTGAGKDRMLGIFERAGEHGEPLHFSGRVRIVYKDESGAKTDLDNLLRALRWLTNVGGVVGSGYGVLQSVSLKPCDPPPGLVTKTGTGAIPDSITMDIEFAEPFCMAAPHLDENIYQCLDYVPGAAIAGAIQRARAELNNGPSVRFNTLQKHFDKVRFRHGFPLNSKDKSRPIPAPLSWACITPEPKAPPVLIDVACVGEASMLELAGKEAQIPRFMFDWKSADSDAVAAACGWGKVTKELRTYTAIDPDTGAAMDNKLYSYEMARPEKTIWRAVMDVAEVPAEDRTAFLDELKMLLVESPLLLGKTDASTDITLSDWQAEQPPEPIQVDKDTDLWIVTLTAQTLLLDISELAGAMEPELKSAYKDAWAELERLAAGKPENPLLCLVNYFTNEELVGSNYLHHRFCGTAKPYSPYLMTGAGSVFVLKSDPAKKAEVQKLFGAWLKSGLPLREWAKTKFARNSYLGDYWSNCPFIPQNGFGEIVVNHPIQTNLLHQKLGVKAIAVKNGGAQ
jgi:hypothetical protein